jgi:hypothetical protein
MLDILTYSINLVCSLSYRARYYLFSIVSVEGGNKSGELIVVGHTKKYRSISKRTWFARFFTEKYETEDQCRQSLELLV